MSIMFNEICIYIYIYIYIYSALVRFRFLSISSFSYIFILYIYIYTYIYLLWLSLTLLLSKCLSIDCMKDNMQQVSPFHSTNVVQGKGKDNTNWYQCHYWNCQNDGEDNIGLLYELLLLILNLLSSVYPTIYLYL